MKTLHVMLNVPDDVNEESAGEIAGKVNEAFHFALERYRVFLVGWDLKEEPE